MVCKFLAPAALLGSFLVGCSGPEAPPAAPVTPVSFEPPRQGGKPVKDVKKVSADQ